MLDNSLDNVVHAIFAICDPDKSNRAQLPEIVKCITPFLDTHTSELLELEDALKETSGHSGVITRSAFMEAMAKWSAKYKECSEQLEDSFDGMLPSCVKSDNSFVHSTPRTSLGVLNHDAPLIPEQMNVLNTSTASCPDIHFNRTILEDRIKDLQYTNWRLTESNRRQKAQEQFLDDQIDILKRDLDLMTNKYTLAQKLIETFNKIDAGKDDSADVDTFEENSQLELDNKYKTLQKDFDLSKAEFVKQVNELEYEKMQAELRTNNLKSIVTDLQITIKEIGAELLDRNGNIDRQRQLNDALTQTNNELMVQNGELNTVVEAFKSQQKKMETNLRKSLCYNDRLQTSFNALQAVKAIGEYSKSRQTKPTEETEVRLARGIPKAEVPFSPPFKNSRFSFYDINAPKIRKSPSKDVNSTSMQEIRTSSRDVIKSVGKSKKNALLNTSSPPVMYVVGKTPPAGASTNSTFDGAETSYDEARFSNVEPRSPHMSLQAEMQEALLCCCEETKQETQLQICSLEGEIKRQTLEKEELRREIVEYTKLLQTLENDKLRGVATLRNLELEIQTLKQKVRPRETNIICGDFSNSSLANQGRQKNTFDKLKMKLEKYENLLEIKNDELNNVKTSCEVYKNRLTENDTFVNNLYINNKSLSKLIKTMNVDLQTEVQHFFEKFRAHISGNSKMFALLQNVFGESDGFQIKAELNDPSAELLDFSRRFSAATEGLRMLADTNLQFNEIQLNGDGASAVNIQATRFKCDSPDSPSVNDAHFIDKGNRQDGTVFAEADTKEHSEIINVHGNMSTDENINLSEEKNLASLLQRREIGIQTSLEPPPPIRTNGVVVPSIGLLLTILYLLYEVRTVQFRNDRTM